MALQIFYGVGIVATVLLVLQLALTLLGLGGDHDLAGDHEVGLGDGPLDMAHTEVGHDVSTDHTPGPGLLSLRTILAFFVGFGWGGAFLLRLGLPTWVAVLGALGIGGAFFLLVFWLMGLIYSLAESGTIDLRNAVGQTGTVYLPIPPRRSGQGQVQVRVQGRLRELPAMTDAAERLPTGTLVRVVAMLTSEVVLVEKL